MIINTHGHIEHKNCSSAKGDEYTAKAISKMMKVPIDAVYKNVMPLMWGNNAEAHVKAMDEAGIDKSLIMAVDMGMNSDVGEARWTIEEKNEWVAKEAEQYPDKLYTLCAVDPRRGDKAIKLVEKAITKWGMKGVKFHPTAGYYPDDPEYYPLYEKCVELDVPVCSHTAALINAPFMSKYADPIYLDTLAAKFPDLKIQLIHFGSLSYTMKCVEIMAARPNVYADLSGYQAHALVMPDYFLKTLRYIFDTPAFLGTPLRERLMFGTDWPALETLMNQKTWVEWIQNIPETAQEYGLKFKQREIKNLLYRNAEKFFQLK
jgi:predicted TIM-barrel fold metal-dependent hydrolase